ncbi:MAG: TraR/DksA family transcriptional regulator [Balneolaceae bacterium]|nr:MAG: TraR/DksA family transcriptional regulator [Balneolaceae bacterium]
MKTEELEEIKKLIDSQIGSTEQEIRELTELTQPITLDNSIGRLSRMDAINNKAINEKALRDKKNILQRLRRAEERAGKGELGTCLRCGDEIPFGRLKFLPYTTRCVKCA